MHMTVIKQQIVDRYPWVPMNLLVAFDRAKAIAYGKMKNPQRKIGQNRITSKRQRGQESELVIDVAKSAFRS